MFEKITDRTSTVLRLAGEQSKLLGHHEVHTGHIAVALAIEGKGVAANVMRNLDVDFDQLPAQVAPHNLSVNECAAEMALLDSASAFAAKRIGHWYRGTEHLLLGIALLPSTIGARCLTDCGVPLSGIGQEVLDLLGHFDIEWTDFDRESWHGHPT